MTQSIKDHLLLHFLVAIWGFTAVLGKLISLPSVEMVWYRTGLSAIGLVVVIFFGQNGFSIVGRGAVRRTIISGLLFGIHWITFFLSVKVANVSICLIGMASTAFWTSFLEPYILKEKFRKLKVIFSIVGMMGIVLIFYAQDVEGPGLILALISAFCSSLFTIYNSLLVKDNSHFTITFYEMLIAFVAITLFLPVYAIWILEQPIQLKPTTLDWFYLLVLAIVCTVFAYSYAVKLMRRLAPFTINFTLNLEPVYGIAIALLIFGQDEIMSSRFYVGASIILLSVIIYPWVSRRYFARISKLHP